MEPLFIRQTVKLIRDNGLVTWVVIVRIVDQAMNIMRTLQKSETHAGVERAVGWTMWYIILKFGFAC